MSRSKLRNRYMRKKYSSAGRNRHRLDEMPKNRPSRYVSIRCNFCMVSWLQESGTFGGHKVRHAGHRMVSGIVRQKVKVEIRQQIADELNPVGEK